jgi:ACS family hexuronate transporter-like MFS transporter
MQSDSRHSSARTLTLLHPVFLLTGILHAIGGPLLPSVAATFHLNDRQSGFLFLLYFAGSSLGALLCIGSYARIIAIGFVAVTASCLAVAAVDWPVLLAVYLLLGISVGAPMSAVSLFVGRSFPQRTAPVLAFLNLSWSAGALIAPLLAARVLVHHGFRTAYILLAAASAIAAAICAQFLRDDTEPPSYPRTPLRLLHFFKWAWKIPPLLGYLPISYGSLAVVPCLLHLSPPSIGSDLWSHADSPPLFFYL